MFLLSLQRRYLPSAENYIFLLSNFHYSRSSSFINWQILPKLLITLQFINSCYWSVYAVCCPPDVIKFTKVSVIGTPIIINDMGNGISCLNTLAINIPIEDAENAVKLYVTWLG